MKTGKWSALLAAVIAVTSLGSSVTWAADYTQGLEGSYRKDNKLVKGDGSSVQQSGNSTIYDFGGRDQSFSVENKDAVSFAKDGNLFIVNNIDASGNKGTITLRSRSTERNALGNASGLNIGAGSTTINSNLVVETSADYMTDGIWVGGNGTLTINGNVKMRKDDNDNPWGVVTNNVHGNYGPGGYVTNDGLEYTGARWQPTGLYVSESRGHMIVNGDVDIAVRGTAVITNTYNGAGDITPDELSSISLLGKSTRIMTPFQEEAEVAGFGKFIEPYYSLASYGGTVNVNVKDQVAQNGKVEIVGNVISMKRSSGTYTPDVYQDGRINIGLTTSDSYWKGLIDNANLAQTSPTEKDKYGHPKYDPAITPVDADHSGEVNLWLQNGAQWIYENASRKDGLDYKHMPEYSQSSYGSYDGMSHLTRLIGGKDQDSAGIIQMKEGDPIQIGMAEGTTKVWYDHADKTPGTMIGGDVKVLGAKEGAQMMLYTGNNGITKGLSDSSTAADRNIVSSVLNELAHKLWYMAGDTNLTGTVSIAEGLTASSASARTENITFSTVDTGTKRAGQGFYDYTPETDTKTYETGAIKKSENIGETRESDLNGVVTVSVTEKQEGAAGGPSALFAGTNIEGPMTVDLNGHTLALSTGSANNSATIYVDDNKKLQIVDSKGNGKVKISAGLNADGNAEASPKYIYGINISDQGTLTADADVEIDGVKTQNTRGAYGLYTGNNGNVVFNKDLIIKNVADANSAAAAAAGIYLNSSSSGNQGSTVTIKGNLDIENIYGSAIRVQNGSILNTAGGVIKAYSLQTGDTANKQYYALQANKGTINLNTGDGITAGVIDVTGDMKVSDNATSVINVNLTKGSKWTGAAMMNKSSSTYNPPSGQLNLTMADGSGWTHETGRSSDTANTSFAGSNISKLNGSGGVIYQNSDKAITAYTYSGDTTVVYQHAADNPLSMIGGDFTIKAADAGSTITLMTDSKGISAGFSDSDTAAEKNNVKEILNQLAQKLTYAGYADGHLKGTVKIADGLTSSDMKIKGDITFSDGTNGTKIKGQGFFDYTPEQDKPNYKTGAITKSEDISLSRELDENGVAHVDVKEANAGSGKFTSALYASESTSKADPMMVKMGGKGLSLHVETEDGQAAAIYADANSYIQIVNPSSSQKLSLSATNADTRASHGIYALGNAHLTISGPVEIAGITTEGSSVAGITVQGQQSEITIDGSLKISDVTGKKERGAGISVAGINVTGDQSAVNVTGAVDISGIRGSGIKLIGADTRVSVGGGTITAAEDSDKSHNYYAARVEKGTLDINMKDGSEDSTTTKITGDMYVTGQYGKKVVEYTGGELIDWHDAGTLNLALTNADSFWKGVAAYDQYNSSYGTTGGNTTHDIGQFNLYLQNGATWTNEQQSHVTTTTIASQNPVWEGSTLATLNGGKDADHAGLIYQKDTNPISVVNYSGHTTVFYDHDASDPTKIIGGGFNITNAAEGSAITFITDNKGITSGFADGDSSDAKDKVARVLNNLAGKLFYKNYTDGHLAGVVKIADGLTASSAALKTGDISFSTDQTGTSVAGQGYYAYTTSKPGSQTDKEFTAAITGDASVDTVYVDKGVLKDDGTYVFTADSTTITPEKHLIAGGAWSLQIGAAISGSDENHNVTMDMNGNKLTVDTTTDTHTTGIAAIGKGVVNIKNAGAMSVSVTSTGNGQTGALFVNAGGTINIHNAGADNVLTLRAKSTAPANAAVIKSMNGVNGVMSSITVDGLVDILADKSGASGANEAISAVASKVEIGGGVIKAVNGAEYAIRAYGEFNSKNRGQVNVNVKKDAEGSIIGAGNNQVQMEGNVYLGGGMDNNTGANADVSLGLNTKDSFWKGDISNANGSSAGIVNLYMGSGASWIGNNLSGNTVNANLDHATWTGSSSGNAMHLKLDDSIWNVNGASKIASFSGNKGSIFVASDAGDISVGDYSGNTTVIYNHDADHPTNILGGNFTIAQAKDGAAVTLITDNQGIAKGFTAYDKAEDQNTVNEVLNKLAQKLFYTANDVKLAGTVKIADGLTASSAALKTGDISFSTDATGTKTPGQGFYEYTVKDDSVITDRITGDLDKKYVNLGIETEKGIYNFTQDTVIDVTKGDYSSNLSAIESSGGPITINADGKNLDVSYHVLKGSNVARAVATGLSYGKSKDITIEAKSLKLSTDTTGFRAQGVYAVGGKITIDADTTISTSAQTESNGIYSGNGGTVTMNGNLTIQKDSKAANYIALNSDDNGVINVNMKDGKAGAGIVKIDGDVFTKLAESYDDWEDETTSTSSTVNLALQGKDSSWNGRSLYKVTSGEDSTSYGTFNLWLTDGATWTNEKNGKEVPSGFDGSHVTNFNGNGGVIVQNDTKAIKVDTFGGDTTVIYKHEIVDDAAREHASLYGNKAVSIIGGDVKITHAAEGASITLVTDRTGLNLDTSVYTDKNLVNDALDKLANKLFYTGYADGHLKGYVKIAEGLTASSITQVLRGGDISYKDNGQGYYDYTISYPEEQIKDPMNTVIDGSETSKDTYREVGIYKDENDSYQFTKNPATITSDGKSNGLIEAKDNNVNVTAKDTLKLVGKDGGVGILAENGKTSKNEANVDIMVKDGTGILADAGHVEVTGNADIKAGTGLETKNGGTITIGGRSNITADAGKDAVKATGEGSTVDLKTGMISGNITAADAGKVITDSADIKGNVTASSKGVVSIKAGAITGDVTAEGGTISTDGTAITGNVTANAGTIGVTAGSVSGNVNAAGGMVTMNGTDITGHVNVTRGGEAAMTNANAAGITVDKDSKASAAWDKKGSNWKGDVENAGTADISFKEGASWIGDSKGDGNTSVTIAKDSTWTGQSSNANTALTLEGTWKQTGGSQLKSLNGQGGVLDMTDGQAGDTVIGTYSGSMRALYKHDEAKPMDVQGGTITVNGAKAGSSIDLITDSKGLRLSSNKNEDKNTVSETLNQLAHKLIYKGDEGKLTGKVGIAEGLTSSGAAIRAEEISFDENGMGQFVYDPAKDDISIEYGSEETRMMQGTKSSLLGTTMMWRSNNNDLLRRMGDLRLNQGETGAWARYIGGKNKFDQQHTYLSQSYDIAQAGYDKKVGDWSVGLALDHGNGRNSFLGGKAKEKMTTLAFYGSKVSDDGSYIDIILKTGKVSNKFDVSNEVGNKLHSDYSTWGNSLSLEYGKRFVKDNGFYLDPSVELTMGRLNRRSYIGTSDLGELHVRQHAFNSAIGRIGLSFGKESKRGNVFGKLAVAHEFGGAFRTDFFAEDGGLKSTRIDLKDTWLDLELGGTLKLGDRTSIYGTFTRNFAADLTTKWRVDAGVRLTF